MWQAVVAPIIALVLVTPLLLLAIALVWMP